MIAALAAGPRLHKGRSQALAGGYRSGLVPDALADDQRTALKLCAGLGVSPNELFKRLSWAPPSLTKGQPLFGAAAGPDATAVER
jgi:hypothetical protein